MLQKNNAQVSIPILEIQAIIGLGNPGPAYSQTRHNAGFMIVDTLASQQGGIWSTQQKMQTCSIMIDSKKILLVKPMTFMNNSGQVLAALKKQGIAQENILVVHDELELPFGTLKFKFDGSAKGHNGLKSIMAHGGSNFLRLRFGVDRPAERQTVPDYVLRKFNQPQDQVELEVDKAVKAIVDFIIQDR